MRSATACPTGSLFSLSLRAYLGTPDRFRKPVYPKLHALFSGRRTHQHLQLYRTTLDPAAYRCSFARTGGDRLCIVRAKLVGHLLSLCTALALSLAFELCLRRAITTDDAGRAGSTQRTTLPGNTKSHLLWSNTNTDILHKNIANLLLTSQLAERET